MNRMLSMPEYSTGYTQIPDTLYRKGLVTEAAAEKERGLRWIIPAACGLQEAMVYYAGEFTTRRQGVELKQAEIVGRLGAVVARYPESPDLPIEGDDRRFSMQIMDRLQDLDPKFATNFKGFIYQLYPALAKEMSGPSENKQGAKPKDWLSLEAKNNIGKLFAENTSFEKTFLATRICHIREPQLLDLSKENYPPALQKAILRLGEKYGEIASKDLMIAGGQSSSLFTADKYDIIRAVIVHGIHNSAPVKRRK